MTDILAVQKLSNELPERFPWMDDALCAQIAPDAFFPERDQPSSVAMAKTICGMCPVRDECLSYALNNMEIYGIWGGTSELERRTLRRNMRPRLTTPGMREGSTPDAR